MPGQEVGQRPRRYGEGLLHASLPSPLLEVPEEGEAQTRVWEEALRTFLRDTLYKPLPRKITIAGTNLSFSKLFREVINRHGYVSVTTNRQWAAVGRAMGLPKSAPSSGTKLKETYRKFLLMLEDSQKDYEPADIDKQMQQMRREVDNLAALDSLVDGDEHEFDSLRPHGVDSGASPGHSPPVPPHGGKRVRSARVPRSAAASGEAAGAAGPGAGKRLHTAAAGANGVHGGVPVDDNSSGGKKARLHGGGRGKELAALRRIQGQENSECDADAANGNVSHDRPSTRSQRGAHSGGEDSAERPSDSSDADTEDEGRAFTAREGAAGEGAVATAAATRNPRGQSLQTWLRQQGKHAAAATAPSGMSDGFPAAQRAALGPDSRLSASHQSNGGGEELCQPPCGALPAPPAGGPRATLPRQPPPAQQPRQLSSLGIDELVPVLLALPQLGTPDVQCLGKGVYTDAGGGKCVGLLINKTGLYGFQPNETLSARYVNGGRTVVLTGTNDPHYTLFSHPALPGVRVRLEDVMNGGTRNSVPSTPLPAHTWTAHIDCSDVLGKGEVLEGDSRMRRALSKTNSGCMMLYFRVRPPAGLHLTIEEI